MISFIVPSVPVAQPRHRHSKRNGISISYIKDDHPVHTFKMSVQLALKEAYQGAPLDGPLELRVVFVLPRPKKYMRKKDPVCRIWTVAKPDLDNLVKSLKDSLKNMAWRDDAQVCVSSQRKYYAAMNEQPRAEVYIGAACDG